MLLKRELGGINHKRVYRPYRLEQFKLRQRKRKRVAILPREAPMSVSRPREAWAMEFMHDVLVDGRRFRTSNILDLATRECLAIEVDTSLPGQRVLRVLDQLIAWYGVPKRITLDNGPKFSGRALDA